jgi:hypothetical protein
MVAPQRFVDVFQGFSVHPWWHAMVVPLPKPHKLDYATPKAYWPISLLECCGKLLERVVSCHIMEDSNLHGILPPSQFGSRDYHCAMDAVHSVIHSARAAMLAGLSASLLLFDVQRFFDHVRPARLVHLLHLFGYPPPICDWVHAFLLDRSASLRFNGFTSPSHAMCNSTPQGSPLSPILSAIYTAPLLCLAERWTDCQAQLYVDDGALLAVAGDHVCSAHLIASHFHTIVNWMARYGLGIDPDKTNLITVRIQGS